MTGAPKEIVYLVDNWMGCAWYRAHVPGMELKRRGHEVALVDRITPELVAACDVLVLERAITDEALAALRDANSQGKMTVFELDDDLWAVDPTNPGYAAWQDPKRLARLDEAIRGAQLVTTTTHTLASLLRAKNPKVRVLPNMLPSERWPRTLMDRPDDGFVNIGWAGGSSHTADLRLLEGVIQPVLDRYPNARFLHTEYETVPFTLHERMISVPPTNIEEVPETLRQFDIGLAPVADTRFNRSKSDLKFVEYAAAGLPTVVSDVESYRGSVERGVTGFIAKNAKDWIKYISRLVEDAGLRRDMGLKARAFAETRMIEENIYRWEKAYGLEREA